MKSGIWLFMIMYIDLEWAVTYTRSQLDPH